MEVTGKQTAYDMWNHLKATYENKSVNRHIALIDQLFDIRLVNFSDMEQYVQKFTEIDTKLKSMGKQIDDELLAVLMLRGLTEDYRPFRMAVENTATDKLKMETMKQKLLQEGYRMSTDMKVSAVAFAAKHKGNKSSLQSSGERSGTGSRKKAGFDINKVRCHKCHEFGHMARDCPEKCVNVKNAVAKGSNVKGRENVSWLTAMSCEIQPEKWYIDSCSSAHMTRRKDWLTKYDCNAGKDLRITVANNERINVDGKGVAHANLAQGGVQAISNVYHAPDLSANLL